MSALAPTLQAFFTDRLLRQRHASPHTVAAYRDTMRLLLAFAQQQTGKQPCTLDLADLDAPLIAAFLDTCTPTSPSKNERSPAPPRQPALPAATDPRTRSSPSWKASDYADLTAALTAPANASRPQVGITPRSG